MIMKKKTGSLGTRLNKSYIGCLGNISVFGWGKGVRIGLECKVVR